MDEMQVLGIAVSVVITLGSFVAVIMKFTQPINDLQVVIQKLNDNIDALKNDNTQQSKRIDKHGDQIDKLEHKVDKLETKVELYHKEG
jgi:peptidoglycan hydrolase CwlO-like protein